MSDSIEKVVARLAARRAIDDVLVCFAWAADEEHDVAELGGCFTPDATWELGGETWRGRAAIITGLHGMREAGFAGPRAGTRHLVHDVEVLALDVDAGVARCRSLFVLVAPGAAAPVLAVGRYDDELTVHEGAWLIRHRLVTPLPLDGAPR